MAGAPSSKAKRARLLSTILYVISAALIVIVFVLYFRDRGGKTQVPPTPVSIPGQNGLINVVDALQTQGLTVKAAPGGASADAFTPPGQVLTVNDKTVYVFIYATPDDRTIDSDGLDRSTIAITTLAGTPVSAAALKVFSSSNVITVLVDGDAALAARIDAGMKALP